MKENTLDVLFYLFDNYPELGEGSGENRETLQHYLCNAGFMPGEIGRAFDWLESLGDDCEVTLCRPSATAHRVYSQEELMFINTECLNYLRQLENANAISPIASEQVLDRVLELKDEDIELDRFKWVILMVMMNRPQDEESLFFAYEENISADGVMPALH